LPPLRRLVGFAIPGLASLILYAQFVFSARFENVNWDRAHFYVVAVCGELTLASLFALLFTLQAASLLAGVLYQSLRRVGAKPGEERDPVVSGIVLAVTAGLAAAGLYAIVAAVYFAQPILPYQPVKAQLRWALPPILPTAVIALAIAATARRRRTRPADGWNAFLTVPHVSILFTAIGAILESWWWMTIRIPPWFWGWFEAVGVLGAILLGVGLASIPVRRFLPRVLLALPAGFLTFVTSRPGLGTPAVICALATAAWWGHRLWIIARAAPERHGHAS
jgi:energy-converting hydrogenase Eha subunit A